MRAVPSTVLAALTLVACASTPKPDANTPQARGAATAAARDDVASEANAMVAGKPGPDEEVQELDLNGDKKPDAYNFYSKGSLTKEGKLKDKEGAGGDAAGMLLRKEVDLNGDGRIDLWNWYGRDGLIGRQSYDLDFDGKVDVTSFYEKGVVIRKEVFHGFSDKPDTFKYYEKGKLVRVERDANHDGRIDTWEYWEGDQIDRIGEDSNGDGNVDRWIKPKKAG